METTTQRPKRKPTKIEEMSKEQIRQAIIRKRECNTKAQKIVENLLEIGITDNFLLQCLPDINQSHFEDIIEERSITHLCGYPLCSKTLSVNDIPKQKYRISIKSNKVYDITARKSFCSNQCYNAAMYVKKQMLISPLWFREYEEIPKFQLLNLDYVGSMGEEVDVAFMQPVKKVETKSFASLYDFAKASLTEISSDVENKIEAGDDSASTKIDNTESDDQENIRKYEESIANITSALNVKLSVLDVTNNKLDTAGSVLMNTSKPKSAISNSSENVLPTNTSSTKEDETLKKNKKPTSNPLSIVGEIIEKPEKKIDPILFLQASETDNKDKPVKKLPQKKQPLVTALAIDVEKCLAAWFTLDTMLLLFGEDKVREMVADKGECIKEYLNNYAKGIFYSSNIYDQYQALCKKLNMLEIEDRKHDSQAVKKEMKPLPDYRMLQEESKTMELKVKAFYAGETQIPELIAEEPTKKTNEHDNVTNLPLVDKNSQNALRRRIVCQHLNKVLPDLLRSLGLLSLTISSDVRLLVNTFKLKAENIMFKPIQWTLIAIVVIKLLSLRDRQLEYLLEQPMAFEHMQLLLLSYKQDGGYLERLISWLIDIDRLLDTNDTQFTIE